MTRLPYGDAILKKSYIIDKMHEFSIFFLQFYQRINPSNNKFDDILIARTNNEKEMTLYIMQVNQKTSNH